MLDATGSMHVVLNGEIYNFPELRRELENLGHVFEHALVLMRGSKKS